MTWAAYHVAVVSILVGGAGSDEVSATKEHMLDCPSVDELPGETENGEENGGVISVVEMVFSSCTSQNDLVYHPQILPLYSTVVFEPPIQQGHHLVLHLQHFLLQK